MTKLRLPADLPVEQCPAMIPKDLPPLLPAKDARHAEQVREIIRRWCPAQEEQATKEGRPRVIAAADTSAMYGPDADFDPIESRLAETVAIVEALER